MSEMKRKIDKEQPSIPSYIIDAISSITPEFLFRSESSPAYPTETFNISEKLDNSKKEKEKENEYKIGNYLVKKTLGQGTFGKVKLGIYLPSGEKVAIKILEKDRIIEKDDELRVKREFDMLALFNHPNVILVAEIFESNDSFYTVMEYCEGGELFNYIVKNRRLNENESAFFYYQLINGLEYIHSLGIVHRDLKPENLLLTKDHLLKIIDFGLGNYFNDKQEELLITPCGSPCYASPEMVAGNKYNGFKIDIWSTGIILYAMLCGYLPFEDKDNDILFEKILECKLYFPKYVNKMPRDLIEKILVTDPNKRISIEEIKKHPFFLKGKNIFEQEFNFTKKNINFDKNTIDENIDIKSILDNNNENDKNNDKKEKENEKENENDKENINTLNIIPKNQKEKENENENENYFNIKEKEINLNKNELENINNKNSDEKENKNNNSNENGKQDKHNFGINEMEIFLDINEEQGGKEKNNENTEKKEKEEKVEKEEKLEDNIKKRNKKVLVSNLDQENFMKHLHTENEEKNNNLRQKVFEPINKEEMHNQIIQNSLKKKNISGNKSTKNKEKNNIIKKSFFVKNKELKRFNYNKDEIRNRLIKNDARINNRTKSRENKSNKNANKTLNFQNFLNFKKHLIQKTNINVSPKIKDIRNYNRNIIKRRKNYTNIIQNNFGSKERLNHRKTMKKGNIYVNNINNTIDNEKIPYLLKVNFNFPKKIDNFSTKNSKRTRSTGKSNIKMSSYETIKKDKKYLDNLININSNIKKYEEKLNHGNMTNKNKDINNIKIKNNIKEINIQLNDVKIKNNSSVDEYTSSNNLYKDNILKTESTNEKGNQLQKIKKISIPNINTNSIDNKNSNINIIENISNEKGISKEKNKLYNTNTNTSNVRKKKISLKKKGNIESKEINDKFMKKTFQNSKKIKNSKMYGNISGIINKTNILNQNSQEKIFEKENNKKHKININILDNLGYIKINDKINNNTAQYTRKKIVYNFKKKGISNKTEIIEKDNMNYNNRKKLLKDINISNNNSKINTLESDSKIAQKKKNVEKKKKNFDLTINTKENKKSIIHIKLNSINDKINNHDNKINSNYSKKQNNMISNQKISNKVNNSNISALLKNPFLNESNYVDSLNPSINHNYSINNNYPSFNFLNRNTKNSQIISHKSKKKKPCVTIRNTVINFNVIDPSLFSALNRRKELKKRNYKIGPNNSVYKIKNNRLYGLCSKYSNGNISNSNSTNTNFVTGNTSNINYKSIADSFPLKTKTINVKSNYDLNSKKIFAYEEVNKSKESKKSNYLGNKSTNKKNMIDIQDKSHIKYNSMKLREFNESKDRKRELKNLNINNLLLNTINDNNKLYIKNEHFNTANNGAFSPINEKNKIINAQK